jgi:hypothetical protein
VDSGGFTTAERNSAQAALDLLRKTSIPRTVVAISYQSGQAPTTCVVMPESGTEGAFKLFMAWKPTGDIYKSVPQNVLEATIAEASSKGDRFHVSTFGGQYNLPEPASVEASLVRAVLAKPAEQCEVLENGHLQLVAAH